LFHMTTCAWLFASEVSADASRFTYLTGFGKKLKTDFPLTDSIVSVWLYSKKARRLPAYLGYFAQTSMRHAFVCTVSCLEIPVRDFGSEYQDKTP